MKFVLSGLTLMVIALAGPLVHAAQESVKPRPDIRFTLRTDIAEGKLVFVSESGPNKGQVNPDLTVPENSVVLISVKR